MPWDEDQIHRWLSRLAPPAVTLGGRGHDAAVLRPSSAPQAVCVDQVVEGVHVEPRTSPRIMGQKACLRALSDLAATAARPRGILLAIRAPEESTQAQLKGLIRGASGAAADHGAALLGGDLSCGRGPLSVAVTALGEVPSDVRPPHRSRMRPGNILLCSGPLGGSRLGRHLRPQPRLNLGRWLHGAGATAMMDVSDGLAWDAFRMARTAGVRLHLDHVPLHPDAVRLARQDGRTAIEHALHDGEDHELLACLPKSRLRALLASSARSYPDLVVIGRVEAGSGLRLTLAGKSRLWRPGQGGWRHGSH